MLRMFKASAPTEKILSLYVGIGYSIVIIQTIVENFLVEMNRIRWCPHLWTYTPCLCVANHKPALIGPYKAGKINGVKLLVFPSSFSLAIGSFLFHFTTPAWVPKPKRFPLWSSLKWRKVDFLKRGDAKTNTMPFSFCFHNMANPPPWQGAELKTLPSLTVLLKIPIALYM